MPVNVPQETIVPAQTTPKQTFVARVAEMLGENGTLVVVVAAFAAVLITHLRTALAADSWMALLSGRIVAQHGLPSHDTSKIGRTGAPGSTSSGSRSSCSTG